MRVAHVLPWNGVAGTEQATLRIARAVEPAGIESVAFCLDSSGSVESFFRGEGLETGAWKLRHPVARRAGRFLRSAFDLAHELRRRRIDVVHCADVRAASTIGALAGRLTRTPVLCHVRNRCDEMWPPSRRCLRFVDRFVFVSHDTWRRFGYAVDASRGQVLYDAVALPPPLPAEREEALRWEVRRELGIPDRSSVVGTVARVEPQKDFATLARAAALVLARRPETTFLVVGGTTRTPEQRRHLPQVRAWLAEAGVADRFVFTDQRRDVDRLLAALDVFVLSTHHEGLPLVLLEAAAHGRPIVASEVDGVPEVVDDGRTGLLVPPRSPDALAGRLLALLDDRPRAATLAEAGRSEVRERFAPQRFARELVELYRRTCPSAASARGDGSRSSLSRSARWTASA